MKKPVQLTEFMTDGILADFRSHKRYASRHVFKSALESVKRYAGGDIPLSAVTPLFLKGYERWLLDTKGLSMNTSSTYLRVLQAVYNRALSRQLVSFIPRHFSDVFTGVQRNHNRAMSADDMNRLLTYRWNPEDADQEADAEEPKQPTSQAESTADSPRRSGWEMLKARACLELMLRLRGLPFVDLAFLHKSDIQGNYLVLRRQKTGSILRIRLTGEIRALLQKYRCKDASSPLLLNILDTSLSDAEQFDDYRRNLRTFNAWLKKLAMLCGVDPVEVSSYSARHTWATTAKYCHIPVAVISESLGHASPVTTEAYLKSFGDEALDNANRVVTKFIFGRSAEQ
jgi:integrase